MATGARTGQDEGVIRALAWLFAGGGVFWLVSATQSLAYLLSADGRRQMAAQLTAQNLQAASPTITLAVTVGLALVAALVHAVVYYGLRGRRFWGWMGAVIVSVAYSLVLVGIPILYLLLRRGTRAAFGVGQTRSGL